MRACGYCEHSELEHFGFDCACCSCLGFTAREISTPEEEREYLRQAMFERRGRGQIGDTEVLDEYSGIREHLGKIMERVSRE